jgi:hypothetical protein
VQATDRIVETLVGAAVGVLTNLLVPPSPRTRTAGAAVEDFGDAVAELLERVAVSLTAQEATREQADGWLDEARAVAGRAGAVDRVLAEARESRRLNPRAVGTVDPTPDLRSGLAALEHSAVALRAVFRSIADGAATAVVEDGDPDGASDDLRQAFAVLMGDLARAVRAFGALVRTQADQADQPHAAELAEALDAVREARVRLTELLLVDPPEAVGPWQSHGSLLAGVERVLAELDLDEYGRRIERHRREAAALRRPGAEAAERLRTTTRRVVTDRPPLTRSRRRRQG